VQAAESANTPNRSLRETVIALQLAKRRKLARGASVRND
jgi:hypothetical protein